MEKKNKQIFFWITNAIFSIFTTNLGVYIFDQNKVMSLITILNGIVLFYFFYYSYQIKTNEENIKDIKDWIKEKEEVLNTLKEIVILKKISRIK